MGRTFKTLKGLLIEPGKSPTVTTVTNSHPFICRKLGARYTSEIPFTIGRLGFAILHPDDQEGAPNFQVDGSLVRGPALVVRVNKGAYDSLSEVHLTMAMDWAKQLTRA